MSSPIATKKKSASKELLIQVHQRVSHSNRIQLLGNEINAFIKNNYPEKTTIRCLDVGCGDMEMAELIGQINPKTQWSCVDIYELPEELRAVERWEKYVPFDGRTLPFDHSSFDVVLFCDVLHHAENNIKSLLTESARVGKLIIVKDHFEYSFVSRQFLRAMDFVGNWGYGVSIPKRYFSPNRFEILLNELNLKQIKIKVGIQLYNHLPIIKWILRPNWQFISSLASKPSN